MTRQTPFPTRPVDVVSLTVHEFTFDLELSDAPSLDTICARFVDDANRALVWLVRYRALKVLSERPGMADWFGSEPRTPRAVCEVAARFALNDRWEFDPEPFCSAVTAIVSRRWDPWRM